MSKSPKAEQAKEVIIKLWIPAKNLKYVNTGKFVDIDTKYMSQMANEIGARWAFYVRDKGTDKEFERLMKPISSLCGTGSTDAKAYLKAVLIFPYEGDFKKDWERCVVGPKGLTTENFLNKVWKEEPVEDKNYLRKSNEEIPSTVGGNCFLRINTNAWSLSTSPDLKKIISDDIAYKSYKAEKHIFFDTQWFYKDMYLMNYKCTRIRFDEYNNPITINDRDRCLGKELERIEIQISDPDYAWLTLAKPTGLDMFK